MRKILVNVMCDYNCNKTALARKKSFIRAKAVQKTDGEKQGEYLHIFL